MPELFINPLALTELRHGNKGRAGQKGYGGAARGERSYELAGGEACGKRARGKRTEEDEERRRREREGLSFLLLINYFRDKRWPAVEKRENEGPCVEAQLFSLALTLSRAMPSRDVTD